MSIYLGAFHLVTPISELVVPYRSAAWGLFHTIQMLSRYEAMLAHTRRWYGEDALEYTLNGRQWAIKPYNFIVSHEGTC